jgi:hypothetical protein
MMPISRKFALAATMSALLPTGVQAALVSFNSTSNLTALGRTHDNSGQDPFVGGSMYASAGQPSYLGALPASWYTVLNAADSALLDSAQLPSSVHMGYAGKPELTVAGKAYQDVTTPTAPTNWGHNSDFGLFRLTSASDVTITVSADNNSNLSPGFSVWQGWDSSTSSTRHQTWANNGAPLLSAGAAAPFGSNLGKFEGTAYTADVNGSATLTLHDLPSGDYTLVLGGYQGLSCNSGSCVQIAGQGGYHAEYAVSFTTATPSFELPLPAPGALFAAALGMGYFRRRIA